MKLELAMGMDGAYLRTVATPGDLPPTVRVDARDDAHAREDLLALYDVAYGRLGPAGLFVAFPPLPVPFACAA